MKDTNHLFNKKAAFLSLGCKVNAYECESIKQQFMSYGCKIVDFKEFADIYVVNTCTVTAVAGKKSRQMLRRAKELNPQALIVACGCYVQESHESLSKENYVDILVGNRLKNHTAEYVNDFLNGADFASAVHVSSDITEFEEMTTITDNRRVRVDIKIQDGCNQFCSYCIIPYARGRISSRDPRKVISEIEGLAGRGFKEVVLTGIHLSSYGLEDYSVREQRELKTDQGIIPLLDLIEKVNAVPGIERIRIGSVEPRVITDELVERLVKCEKFMPHFHLSLQSGCDSVLARMNRRYDTAKYKECCDIIRKYYYKPSITTDIIVGFPGETEEEFAVTKAYAEEIGFAAIHIFPFSRREGTAADRMEGQLENAVKNGRLKELSAVETVLRNNYEKSFDGEIRPVLVEEKVSLNGKIYNVGHTPEYVKVYFLDDFCAVNDTVDVKMSDKRLTDGIEGVS